MLKDRYLFRGKRVDNGEWVHGDLVINRPTHTYRIFTDYANVRHGDYTESGLHEDSGCLYIVDPKTVGQFTGLTDKNGVKIFEGDIIALGEVQAAIEFIDGGFQMITSCNQGKSMAIQDRVKRFDIIGNIHDNKELLNNKKQ